MKHRDLQSRTDHELGQIIWDYMRYEQPLKKADIIIGLGSHDIEVARYAASLYADGYAPLIMFCGATGRITSGTVNNEADWYAEEAIGLGVPNSAILRERRSMNTGENIVYAHELLRVKGIVAKRIIIVHKPYMLRRDYATIMKQWPGKKRPMFIFSAQQISMEEYIAQRVSFEAMANVMVGDLQRIKEYPKLGFQIEQEIPAPVWSAYEQLVSRGYDKHLLK